jgi:SAM-dependent methyltransferase
VHLDLSDSAVDGFLAQTLERPGFPGSPDVLADTAFEARLAVDMLRPLEVTTEARILEVGAGSGTVTAFLAAQGANIVGIEPYRDSYEGFEPIRAALEAKSVHPHLLAVRADELDPARHDYFDLIFSVNVIEHFQPLGPSLDGLARVLSSGGRMVHTCPNYRVPYEPHLRAPLIPVLPSLTGRIWPQLRENPVWATLNWVTAADIRHFADRHGFALRFRPGRLSATLDRLAYDPAFARRQRGVARLAAVPGVAKALRLLPSTWSTPMTFELLNGSYDPVTSAL